MSTTYTDIGQDLYNFMEALDISSVADEGWASKFNRPPKSDELLYPAYCVIPLRDAQAIEDNQTDNDTISYSVYLFFDYWNASQTEADIRTLVDLVRSAFRLERAKPEPLNAPYYDISFAGEWGGNETQNERFYRLDVTIKVLEDLL